MNDKEIRILSTRLIDEELVRKAQKNEIVIDSISFIQTERLTNELILQEIEKSASKSIAAVFTSTNGAEAVIEVLEKNRIQPSWKIYCIGLATQSLIRKYFKLSKVVGSGKNAIELSEAIIQNDEKEIIFFCGNQRRDELPKRMRESNIEVQEITVYETKEIAVKIEKRYNGILFFSPSAVKSFFSVNTITADTVLFSIGETTAEEIKKNSKNKIIISNFPSEEKVVEIATKYFKGEK